MKMALSTLLNEAGADAYYGLMLFPGQGGDCSPGAVDVPIADPSMNDAIKMALGSVVIGLGDTPIDTSLQAALTYYQGIPINQNGRYVLLATDGKPTCNDTDLVPQTVMAVEALAAQGIKTFVIGIGMGISTDGPALDMFAQAGLMPRANGPPFYYPVGNPMELVSTLKQIVGTVVPPCTIQLSSAPPIPTDVRVLFDNQDVVRSPTHSDGWDYDPATMTITFYGPACDEIQSGSVTEIQVVFGCPGPIE
jgi:hypothetical protein